MSNTPVWQTDAFDLDADLGKVAQQWGAVREILQNAELYALHDPEVSGWSCGEQAGHIAMVTRWVASGIEEVLADPSRDVDGEQHEQAQAILQMGDFPRGVAISPEKVDPVGKPRGAYPSILDDAEQLWAALSEKREAIIECPARFPHFILGYFTSVEWVRFCALHTAHHLAVVRDIRAAF